MRKRPVELVSGDYVLPCEIWLPEGARGEARVSIVLCHGSTRKGMEHELVQSLASSLSAKWPVLTPELPGFGKAPELVIRSTSDYLFHGLLIAAAELAEGLTGLPAVLVGHSMGGRVSLQAAPTGQGTGLVVGVATLAGLYELPGRPEQMLVLLREFARYARVRFETPLERLAEDIAGIRPTRKAVEGLGVPLLAIEAGREAYSFIRETRYGLFKLARCPKALVLIGGADHKFRGYHDVLADILVRWLELRFP